jgi:glycosyltransferase involved in cell wall biosynthesis
MPLVSVVIATFERPDALTRAIYSALGQTIADIEVIVVAEKGDVATVAAVEAVTDPRVRYVINPHKNGPGPARDTGADASTSEWIAFLDDDDEWLPDKLAKQLEALPDAKSFSMTLSRVVSDAGTLVRPTFVYDNKEPIDEWLFGRRTWFGGGESMLQTSSLVVPRAMFDEIRFGTAQHEEWELAIRAVKQLGYRLVTVREPLVIYYTGRKYPWQRSAIWIEAVKDLVTKRAFSGFCLTTVTQGLDPPNRNHAFFTLLKLALRYGRPTAKQIFAFALIWIVPHEMRQRVRQFAR